MFDVALSSIKLLYFFGININTKNFEADLSVTQQERQTDVAKAKNANNRGFILEWVIGSKACSIFKEKN